MKIFLLVLFLLLPDLALAGGGPFNAQILDFKYKGNSEFVIELKVLKSMKYFSDKFNDRITINLRYKKRTLFDRLSGISDVRDNTNNETYIKAINELNSVFKSGESLKFGLLGPGLIELDKEKGLYQSNSLKIINGIVYSYE